MNANLTAIEPESCTAESIMLRTLEESLPDLWIVSAESEFDIRDVTPAEEYMLEWHYPGKCNLQGIVPEVDLTDMVRPAQGLAAQVPRSQLVARGILSGGRTLKGDF